MRRLGSRLALLLLPLLGPLPVFGQLLEPPPESPEGADYALDAGDSLARGEVELGVGLEAVAGGRLERRRRVRFADGELSGTVRDGAGDPLSGGAVESRGPRHTFAAGRLAPRWGRGLLLGSPGDPWQRSALDRGARAAYRGRSGEGVAVSRGDRDGVDAVAGRFSGSDLAGARARRGPLQLGALAARGGRRQASLGWTRDAGQAELALDRSGAWRGEGLLERPLGPWSATVVVRAGSPGFRSLAEPKRVGSARALILGAGGDTPAGDLSLLAAWWRYRAGRSGARLAVEWRRTLAGGASLLCGLEEQHGVRRDATSARDGLRQGAWIEWSGPVLPLRLSVRHETWGAHGGWREAVRAVTSAALEARAPFGISLRLTHAAYRVRRGESLYLAEAESDRMVLRALAGEGHRSRLEITAPAGRSHVRAVALVGRSATGAARPRWSLEWIRRSRSGASSSSPRIETKDAPGR